MSSRAADLLLPAGVYAGFHAEPQTGGLVHAGEHWAGSGFRISSHTHPVWELHLQVHGRARWRVEHHVFELAADEALLVGPERRHALLAPAGGRHHFVYAAFDPSAVPGTAVLPVGSTEVAVHLTSAGSLLPVFRQLHREVLAAAEAGAHATQAATQLLLVELTRLLLDVRPAAVPAMHPAVAHALHLVAEQPNRPWRVEELAAAVGLSANYFSEVFARDVGMAASRHLVERRLERAAELIDRTELSVTEVAVQLGFATASHFARHFRQRYGCSPTQRRRRPAERGAAAQLV